MESQRFVRWQYQWLVVNDLLPRLVGDERVDQAAATARSIDLVCLPLEFRLAVGQFGHAMVQPRYRINRTLHEVIGTPLFKEDRVVAALEDLRGQPLDERGAVEWDNFFPIGNPVNMQASSRLNAKICRPLFLFPSREDGSRRSIPYLTLAAGQNAGLPSGQAVAREMGFEPIPEDLLWAPLPYRGAPAPLWFYILREADVQEHGRRLGRVGAQIYSDIVLKALFSDVDSYVHARGLRAPMGVEFARSVGKLLESVCSRS